MAVSLPRARAPTPRRPRRGTPSRPVNGRIYRAACLLVLLPALVAALSVAEPTPLPPPALPPTFDGAAAAGLARELAGLFPDPRPGTRGARGAAAWTAAQLESYGL